MAGGASTVSVEVAAALGDRRRKARNTAELGRGRRNGLGEEQEGLKAHPVLPLIGLGEDRRGEDSVEVKPAINGGSSGGVWGGGVGGDRAWAAAGAAEAGGDATLQRGRGVGGGMVRGDRSRRDSWRCRSHLARAVGRRRPGLGGSGCSGGGR
uniref:Uncharacterized protein n=1 Tax=Phyllostachys edulis TaxID=38705 RepID=D3IVT0_PHYED|nr:hypothetical protein [Phyllostachys edulis]